MENLVRYEQRSELDKKIFRPLTISIVVGVQGNRFECLCCRCSSRIDRLLGLPLKQFFQLLTHKLKEGVGHRHAEVLKGFRKETCSAVRYMQHKLIPRMYLLRLGLDSILYSALHPWNDVLVVEGRHGDLCRLVLGVLGRPSELKHEGAAAAIGPKL